MDITDAETGKIGAGDTLREGEHVGLQAVETCTEPMPSTTKSCDHLVRDQKDVVLVQERLHARKIAGRREQHAAGAHDWLGNERSDRIGPLLFNDHLDLSD